MVTILNLLVMSTLFVNLVDLIDHVDLIDLVGHIEQSYHDKLSDKVNHVIY